MAFQELGTHDVGRASVSGEYCLGKSAWYELLASKSLFLSGKRGPGELPGVRPEIAASWMFCLERGVDPYEKRLCTPLSDGMYEAEAGKSASLTEAVKPALSVVESFDCADEYVFRLVDAQGVTLLQAGGLDICRYVERKSLSDESTMGTNAHSLCMRYRMPFQVVGPEHYCCALHNLAASAAPIVDESGIVIASLLMVQPVSPAPWELWYRRTLSHALGFVASLASGVSHQLVYRWVKRTLEEAGGNADAVASVVAESQGVFGDMMGPGRERVIVLDDSGAICQISPEAIRLLKATPAEVWGKPIGEYVELPEGFDASIDFREGCPFDFPAVIGRDEYVVEVRPATKRGGAVLRFRKTRARPNMPAHVQAGGFAQVHFDGLFGSCPSMKAAVATAKRFALSHENVLIAGESGTGKSLFAQAMHNERCPDGPFMSVNCSANPPSLVERELFGYKAKGDSYNECGGVLGKVELADGGTLCLEEVGDMPLDLQGVFLQELESKRVVRLGSKGYHRIDFKVVSTTTKDLVQLAEQGRFHSGLLRRLSESTIELPPLRHRGEDRLLFAHRFLSECRRADPSGPKSFSRETEAVLDSCPWPGNVGQMKRAVISAFYAAQDREIHPDDLPLPVRKTSKRPAVVSLSAGSGKDRLGASSIRALEENAVVEAMKNAGGNVEEAAKMLGISRATLYRRLKQYGFGR